VLLGSVVVVVVVVVTVSLSRMKGVVVVVVDETAEDELPGRKTLSPRRSSMNW
jgi:hypothetical protein